MMSEFLTVGEFYQLTLEEILNFSPENTPTDGEHCWMLSVGYYIPDAVKRKTDDLPMSVKQEIITDKKISPFSNKLMSGVNYKLGKQKSCIASHDPQEKYLISLQLLKLYLGLGMVVKKNRIFRWKQEKVFKEFTDQNIELRKNSPAEFERQLYKLMSNSIYGKLLYNARKNQTETKLITKSTRFDKLSIVKRVLCN
jgi:hypothetical protein